MGSVHAHPSRNERSGSQVDQGRFDARPTDINAEAKPLD
jgi:hypothetical protein